MQRQLIGLTLLAAATLVAILGVAPQANLTMNAASTEILGIDILGLTTSAKELLEHQ